MADRCGYGWGWTMAPMSQDGGNTLEVTRKNTAVEWLWQVGVNQSKGHREQVSAPSVDSDTTKNH